MIREKTQRKNERNLLRMAWRQVCAWIIVTLPVQDPAEQTRLSWARAIGSYAAVPTAYQDFFEPFLAEGCPFPYTILTPTFEGFIRRTTEKLVCDLGREIDVLTRTGNTFEATCYPLEWISYVELRTVLLDSRIKISGVTKQGIPTSSTFRFSSVTGYLFTPILERIRLAAGDCADSKDAAWGPELEIFDHWASLNYKFMSFARRSLLRGEKVIQAILQPEIRVSAFTILGRTHYRRISPPHATILTDRELIVVREDARQRADARYSGVWDYIPLNKIETLSLDEKDDGCLVLSVHLPENERIQLLFQASAKPEVDQLLERHRELTAAS
jgi:hypothetical protein